MLTTIAVARTRRINAMSVAAPTSPPATTPSSQAKAIGRPMLVWNVHTSMDTTVARAPLAKFTTLDVL